MVFIEKYVKNKILLFLIILWGCLVKFNRFYEYFGNVILRVVKLYFVYE